MKKELNNYFISEVPADYPNKRDKLKLLAYRLKAFYFNLKRKTINIKSSGKKYNVAVCTIFKNEALYLREWILFNHIVGVDHFYLYNNNSEDDYLKVLKDFIDSGLVTLNQWTKNQAQMECYMDGIKNYAKECKWLGFIDVDEFIIPKSTDDIYSFLQKFEKNSGAVRIYWKMFGTSGKLERDMRGLVTEDFIVSWPKYYDVGKCFYNTAFDFDFNSVHTGQLHHDFWASYNGQDFPPVNIFNHICYGKHNKVDNSDFPIQINHYFTKSYQEYIFKRAKGDVYFIINPHDEEYFYSHEMENTSTDVSAYKYLVKLKIEMNNT